MSGYDVSCEDHAAIYSAALWILFRATKEFAPFLVMQMSQVAYRRLVVYCAGLCVLRKYHTCFGISRQLGGCSHDALNRLMNSTQWTVSQLMMCCLQAALTMASGTPQVCWLILDDVILPKATSKKMLAAYWDYDYVRDKNIRCLRVVVLCWTNGIIKIPVAWALWHKKGCAYLMETHTKFRTKNQLAHILVYVVQRKGLPFHYLLFDSWYAGVEHLWWYHKRGIRFVTATKNNRSLRLLWCLVSQRPVRPRKDTQRWRTMSPFQLAQQYPHTRDYHYYPAIDCRTRRWEITLEGFSDILSLVCIKNYATNPAFSDMVTSKEKKQKDPNKYLLTNDTSLTVVQIVAWYRRRWSIEVLFRDCKQSLGLSAYQGQTVDAHLRHVACVFFSYVLMEQMKAYAASAQEPANTLTIGQVKEWLNRQYLLKTSHTSVPQMVLIPLSRFSEEELIVLLEEANLLVETENQNDAKTQHYTSIELKTAA